jgi:hypothetical protein
MPLSTAKAPSPFPEIGDNAVTSHSAAQEKQRTFFGRIRRHIWNFGVSLKRPDRLCEFLLITATVKLTFVLKVAIKTGLGCGVLGIAAVGVCINCSDTTELMQVCSLTIARGLFSSAIPATGLCCHTL